MCWIASPIYAWSSQLGRLSFSSHLFDEISYSVAAQGLHPNKRKIETKYRLPLLNWVAIPPTQISGTVFTQLDDESVLKQIDFTDFEETFKAKGQSGTYSVLLYFVIGGL